MEGGSTKGWVAFLRLWAYLFEENNDEARNKLIDFFPGEKVTCDIEEFGTASVFFLGGWRKDFHESMDCFFEWIHGYVLNHFFNKYQMFMHWIYPTPPTRIPVATKGLGVDPIHRIAELVSLGSAEKTDGLMLLQC